MQKSEAFNEYIEGFLTPIVQKCVDKAFQARQQGILLQPDPKEEFMTINQVSEFTHIPVATLYSYSSKGVIPVIKSGKTLLFRKDRIIDWLNDKQKKTASERIREGEKYLASNN